MRCCPIRNALVKHIHALGCGIELSKVLSVIKSFIYIFIHKIIQVMVFIAFLTSVVVQSGMRSQNTSMHWEIEWIILGSVSNPVFYLYLHSYNIKRNYILLHFLLVSLSNPECARHTR